ncbi:Kelch repeat-containing protein [Cohnella sp. 56]|uniref:Kelch repeat-containing protein n=1 Tax=Cohnella sp. 56 TaxID=3113722 RepID=UPI0030E969C8
MKFFKGSLWIVLLLIIVQSMVIGHAGAAPSWSNKANMSIAHSYGASAVVNGKLYAISGEVYQNYTNVVEMFDPTTNTWTTKANYPILVGGHTAAALNGKIYVFGGSTNRGAPVPVSSVYEYDPNTDTWTKKLDMPTARFGASAVVFNNKIYVIGGRTSSTDTNVVEVYDPSTNTWSSAASLNYSNFSGAAFVFQNKLYFLGNRIEEYNSATNEWTQRSAGYAQTLYTYAMVLQGKVYIYSYDGLLNLYNPISNTWDGTISIPSTKKLAFYGVINNALYLAGSHTPFSTSTVEYKLDEISPEAPGNLMATAGNFFVDLDWNSVTGATSYNIKRSTTAGGPYTTIATAVTGTTYNDTGLTSGTKYYYVVTAVNTSGESGNSNEVNAIPTAPVSSGRALLTIHLVGGAEKEYDLAAAELDNFLDWTESATLNSKFKFMKTFNKGPFKVRAEYIVFGKIVNFDVDEYDPEE